MRQAPMAERPVALPPAYKEGAHMAASLFFTCPTTRRKVPAGIETDVQSLKTSWKKTLKVNCPQCGKMHQISVRETYLINALNGPHPFASEDRH
jgi:hypothetical protein